MSSVTPPPGAALGAAGEGVDHRPAADAQALRAQMRSEGVVVLRGLLGSDWVERLRQALDVCRDAPSRFHGVLSAEGEPLVESDLFCWFTNDTFAELARSSPLTRAATTLLGSETVVFIEDQWFLSEPGATSGSPWHQDHPYYNVDRPFVTIWVTLDDVDASASLRVVPGSHRGELYSPVEFASDRSTIGGGSALPAVPNIDGHPELYQVRSWDFVAGDAVAFDSRLLHSTSAEPSGRGLFRRLSTRWIHPDARYHDHGEQAAIFWQALPHGLSDGDRLACDHFPLVGG